MIDAIIWFIGLGGATIAGYGVLHYRENFSESITEIVVGLIMIAIAISLIDHASNSE